jgi:hypothetical protein
MPRNILRQLRTDQWFVRTVDDTTYVVTGFRFTPGLVHLFGHAVTNDQSKPFFNDDHHDIDKRALLNAGIPRSITKKIMKAASKVSFEQELANSTT